MEIFSDIKKKCLFYFKHASKLKPRQKEYLSKTIRPSIQIFLVFSFLRAFLFYMSMYNSFTYI
jgi:hypothetical protein